MCAIIPQNGWCVEFQTSTITPFLGQERDASLYLDYLLLDVSMIFVVINN